MGPRRRGWCPSRFAFVRSCSWITQLIRLAEEYSEFDNGIWAGDAIAAAKKVYRRMKWAESITVASRDNHNEVHHFDSSAFSLSADHKRSQDHRRSCMSKLDVALAGYVS